MTGSRVKEPPRPIIWKVTSGTSHTSMIDGGGGIFRARGIMHKVGTVGRSRATTGVFRVSLLVCLVSLLVFLVSLLISLVTQLVFLVMLVPRRSVAGGLGR